MNQENLIPMSERSKNEVREIARKGGINSGESRRLKKTMKMALIELLQEEAKDKNGKPTGKTYQELANMGLLKGAMKGNAQNYRVLLETIGELLPQEENKNTPTININVTDNSNLEKVMYDD